MRLYAKFMKELLTKKRSLKEGQMVVMTRECSAIIQRGLPRKRKDPGSFHIPCIIGNMMIERAFCDLGASINLIPLSLMRKLQIHELKPTKIALQMADKSIQQALGVVENVLVKVDKFFLPADFVILDIEEDDNTSIILGRPFLATARALIDVEKGELMLKVHEEHIVFHVFKNLQLSTQEEECMKIDSIDPNLKEAPDETLPMHLSSCWKRKEEVEVVQQAQRIEEKLQPKPAFEILSKDIPKIEASKPELPPKKEKSPKKKSQQHLLPLPQRRRAPFTVQVHHEVKPSIFPTHKHWYESSLTSIINHATAAKTTTAAVLHTYDTVFHGFLAKLSPLEAQKLESLSHLIAVIPEQVRQLHTTRLPQFLGLKIADRAGFIKETDFSNLIIGVIDTCPDRESFNDRDLGSVPPNWKGSGGGGSTTQKVVKRVGYSGDKVA
ncbi:uncharacterized protein LOC107607969 [Arachis ipaensis]|uniref:uncharacterized protein LOC107607969 n=1 Tax=Arachis ipaensis TaxID=130454 RepID=UPI0007AEEFA0|nr:uncharacterized protein LOC107607969 [Arachis ipaensis]